MWRKSHSSAKSLEIVSYLQKGVIMIVHRSEAQKCFHTSVVCVESTYIALKFKKGWFTLLKSHENEKSYFRF